MHKLKKTDALKGKRGRGSVAASGGLASAWHCRSTTGILLNGPGAETWSGIVLRGGEEYEETAASRGGGMSSHHTCGSRTRDGEAVVEDVRGVNEAGAADAATRTGA